MSEIEVQPRPAVPPPVLAPLFSRVAGFRIVVAVLVLGSLAAAWWSLTRVLLPAQRECKEASAKMSRLATAVDDLQRTCSRETVQQSNARRDEVRAQLFSDEHSLAAWWSDLQAQAGPLDLSTRANFGRTVPLTGNAQGLMLIPATIEVGVLHRDDERKSPGLVSQRLGQLLRQLDTAGKRIDLAELTVTGNGSSVESSTLVLNLWAESEAAR